MTPCLAISERRQDGAGKKSLLLLVGQRLQLRKELLQEDLPFR